MPLGTTFAEEAEDNNDTHELICPACGEDEDSCECTEDGPIAVLAPVRR
jgi:hypothetical protein